MLRTTFSRILKHSTGFQRIFTSEIAANEVRSLWPLLVGVRGLRTPSNTFYGNQPFIQQETVEDTMQADDAFTKSVISKVNDQIIHGICGRLFAVVYLASKQRLVTPEDLIIVNGTFPPNIGDKIRLEKVMCVGGRDFTLYGRPLLSKDLVNVEATVVEKNLSHASVDFYSWRRHNSRRTKFSRDTHTLLRINRIDIMQKIDEIQEVEGVEGRIF